jgi:hypothetical protein
MGPPDVAERRPPQETAPLKADLAKDLAGYRHGTPEDSQVAAGAQ